MDFGIDLNIEEAEPNGEVCNSCGKIIIGKMYVPMIKWADEDLPKEFKIHWCLECRIKIDGDTTGTKTDEYSEYITFKTIPFCL